MQDTDTQANKNQINKSKSKHISEKEEEASKLAKKLIKDLGIDKFLSRKT